eukprot:TRINITY_DN3276_c0_g1_i1.p1 TRINITY_DN3276_c0_g1~~TRINITY_DN3276_c0_g1_i1.p1  ORF type:complete len:323 (+),score=72.42 TRINITY_DN3276_c0_g1_i1:105-971(+)
MTVYARPVPPVGKDLSPRRGRPLANKTNVEPTRSGTPTYKLTLGSAKRREEVREKEEEERAPVMVKQLSVYLEKAQQGYKKIERKKKKGSGIRKSRYKKGVTLIPPQRDEWTSVYTVVLDMDETLLWHPRLGEVHGRPGAVDLLKGLKGRCETVLWTASTQPATDIALQSIGLTTNDFTHVITRDSRWFSWKTSAKDIRYLNRDPDKVLVIENSPFCISMNKANGLLVSDFNKKMDRDDTLFRVYRIIQALIASQLPVPAFLATSIDIAQKNYKLYPHSPASAYFCLA